MSRYVYMYSVAGEYSIFVWERRDPALLFTLSHAFKWPQPYITQLCSFVCIFACVYAINLVFDAVLARQMSTKSLFLFSTSASDENAAEILSVLNL